MTPNQWIARLQELNNAFMHEDIPKAVIKKIKKNQLWNRISPEKFYEEFKKRLT